MELAKCRHHEAFCEPSLVQVADDERGVCARFVVLLRAEGQERAAMSD